MKLPVIHRFTASFRGNLTVDRYLL